VRCVFGETSLALVSCYCYNRHRFELKHAMLCYVITFCCVMLCYVIMLYVMYYVIMRLPEMSITNSFCVQLQVHEDCSEN